MLATSVKCAKKPAITIGDTNNCLSWKYEILKQIRATLFQ